MQSLYLMKEPDYYSYESEFPYYPRVAMKTIISEETFQHFLSALLSGDRRACTLIVSDLQEQEIQLMDIFLNLFQRALYQVGDLWEHHQISVAVEHLSSIIIEQLMNRVETDLFLQPHQDHAVIVACVADEFHHIGGRMVADIFEIHGWKSHFLGANTPLRDLLMMIGQKRPDLVALSLSMYFNLPSLLSALTEISSSNPGLPILVGGQAFRWGGVETISRYPLTRYVPSLETLEQVMKEYETRS